jgi:hypothetical protein
VRVRLPPPAPSLSHFSHREKSGTSGSRPGAQDGTIRIAFKRRRTPPRLARTGAKRLSCLIASGLEPKWGVRCPGVPRLGDPCESVLYVQARGVTISVLSKTGKEAVVAMLGPGTFFGEGGLAGQPVRMGARPRTFAAPSSSWTSMRWRAFSTSSTGCLIGLSRSTSRCSRSCYTIRNNGPAAQDVRRTGVNCCFPTGQTVSEVSPAWTCSVRALVSPAAAFHLHAACPATHSQIDTLARPISLEHSIHLSPVPIFDEAP